MKKLYILRHAEALPGGNDKERVLSPKGKQDALALGRVMKEKNYVPDFVLCSPAVRTRQTLEEVLKSLGDPITDYPGTIYNGTHSNLMMMIQATKDHYNSLLVVGHNPVVHELTALLAAQSSSASLMNKLAMGYRPGTLSAFECPQEEWMHIQSGNNTLTDFLEPPDY